MDSLDEEVRDLNDPLSGELRSGYGRASRPELPTTERAAAQLTVPSFDQRLTERDVSPGTARRLGIWVCAGASTALVVSLLSSTRPLSPAGGASLFGLCAVAFLCGILAGTWVWGELTLARAFGPTSRLRFIASYAAGGVLVEVTAMLLLPVAGLTSVAPPVIRIISLAVIAPWLAITIGLLFDGRARVRELRRLLVNRAASIMLKGQSKAALLQDLRTSVQRDLQGELGPAFRMIDARLAFEQQFATGHVDATAAKVLRDLADASVRPLSRILHERGIFLNHRSGPLAFIAGVARNQPFRPAVVSGIFALTALLDRWPSEDPARIVAESALGVALILLILGSGNRLMRAFPRHHAAIFLATFGTLQIPTVWREVEAGATLTAPDLAYVLVGFILSACVIWATSGIGEWRSPKAEMLRLYARELDTARIDVLAQTEVIGSITKDAARVLHGSVQSRLAACALTIDRAVLTGDVESYAAAIERARDVLCGTLNIIEESRVPSTLQAEINSKVALWQGLAGITTLVAPEIKVATGAFVRSIGELVEEGLCNAIRHGNADTIAIQVDLVSEEARSSIRIRVVDDGCGPTEGTPGLGSALLDDLCAGRWKRALGPGGGCILDAWVPIREGHSS